MTAALSQSLPRRRGRPRRNDTGPDYGTPELIARKQRGETAEILDLCLERQLINAHQHWCGIHLRWLYTLRHGTPTIRAIDLLQPGGMCLKESDPEWYALREKEFADALDLLTQAGHARLVSAICIYNECPPALGISSSSIDRCIDRLRDGLDMLAAHWQRK